MFTSSIRSFRHALTQPDGRVGRVGRRSGAAVAAVAFCATLPSPAAAQPTLTTPASVGVVAATGQFSASPETVPAGIASADTTADVKAPKPGASSASSSGSVEVRMRAARAMPVRPARVMGVAAAQTGDPYVYGAAGPNAFDCSGLTSYVYRVAAGRHLPRTSTAQYGATQRVSRGAARRGDLVFFHGSGGIYHVALFAGGNSVIHASKPGVPVTRAQIWTRAVSFGRVR